MRIPLAAMLMVATLAKSSSNQPLIRSIASQHLQSFPLVFSEERLSETRKQKSSVNFDLLLPTRSHQLELVYFHILAPNIKDTISEEHLADHIHQRTYVGPRESPMTSILSQISQNQESLRIAMTAYFLAQEPTMQQRQRRRQISSAINQSKFLREAITLAEPAMTQSVVLWSLFNYVHNPNFQEIMGDAELLRKIDLWMIDNTHYNALENEINKNIVTPLNRSSWLTSLKRLLSQDSSTFAHLKAGIPALFGALAIGYNYELGTLQENRQSRGWNTLKIMAASAVMAYGGYSLYSAYQCHQHNKKPIHSLLRYLKRAHEMIATLSHIEKALLASNLPQGVFKLSSLHKTSYFYDLKESFSQIEYDKLSNISYFTSSGKITSTFKRFLLHQTELAQLIYEYAELSTLMYLGSLDLSPKRGLSPKTYQWVKTTLSYSSSPKN